MENAFPEDILEPLEKAHPEILYLAPYDLFKLYFDEDVYSLITIESERNAKQKLNHSFSLSEADLDVFLGIVLPSGYNALPQERLYWSNDEDVGVNLVKKKMSRNRFQEIKRYLHLADNNNLIEDDNLAKIRKYLDLLNRTFTQFGVFSQNLSIDEQMVSQSCKRAD